MKNVVMMVLRLILVVTFFVTGVLVGAVKIACRQNNVLSAALAFVGAIIGGIIIGAGLVIRGLTGRLE